MSIRFPQHHIADSVTRRILEIAQKVNPNSVEAQGARLDRALQQPVGEVAPLEGVEAAVAARALDL